MTKSEIFKQAHKEASNLKEYNSIWGGTLNYRELLSEGLKIVYARIKSLARLAIREAKEAALQALKPALTESQKMINFMARYAHHSCTD